MFAVAKQRDERNMLNLNNNTVTQDAAKFLVELERIYGEFQNLERDLLALLRAHRIEARQGFDALIDREQAAKVLGMSVQSLDRIHEKGGLRSYNTAYGMRFRMGDIIAYAQMRCEAKNISMPRPYRKKGYMSDLDRMIGELSGYDFTLPPKHLRK